MPKKELHPVDVAVGGKIRMARFRARISQSTLAGALGYSFQQIQKYEKGVNRVSASRLYEIARTLNVPVGYFFEGLEDGQSSEEWADAVPNGRQKTIAALVSKYMSLPESEQEAIRALIDSLHGARQKEAAPQEAA